MSDKKKRSHVASSQGKPSRKYPSSSNRNSEYPLTEKKTKQTCSEITSLENTEEQGESLTHVVKEFEGVISPTQLKLLMAKWQNEQQSKGEQQKPKGNVCNTMQSHKSSVSETTLTETSLVSKSSTNCTKEDKKNSVKKRGVSLKRKSVQAGSVESLSGEGAEPTNNGEMQCEETVAPSEGQFQGAPLDTGSLKSGLIEEFKMETEPSVSCSSLTETLDLSKDLSSVQPLSAPKEPVKKRRCSKSPIATSSCATSLQKQLQPVKNESFPAITKAEQNRKKTKNSTGDQSLPFQKKRRSSSKSAPESVSESQTQFQDYKEQDTAGTYFISSRPTEGLKISVSVVKIKDDPKVLLHRLSSEEIAFWMKRPVYEPRIEDVPPVGVNLESAVDSNSEKSMHQLKTDLTVENMDKSIHSDETSAKNSNKGNEFLITQKSVKRRSFKFCEKIAIGQKLPVDESPHLVASPAEIKKESEGDANANKTSQKLNPDLRVENTDRCIDSDQSSKKVKKKNEVLSVTHQKTFKRRSSKSLEKITIEQKLPVDESPHLVASPAEIKKESEGDANANKTSQKLNPDLRVENTDRCIDSDQSSKKVKKKNEVLSVTHQKTLKRRSSKCHETIAVQQKLLVDESPNIVAITQGTNEESSNAQQTVQKLNTDLPIENTNRSIDSNESSKKSKKENELLLVTPQKSAKRRSSKSHKKIAIQQKLPVDESLNIVAITQETNKESAGHQIVQKLNLDKSIKSDESSPKKSTKKNEMFSVTPQKTVKRRSSKSFDKNNIEQKLSVDESLNIAASPLRINKESAADSYTCYTVEKSNTELTVDYKTKSVDTDESSPKKSQKDEEFSSCLLAPQTAAKQTSLKSCKEVALQQKLPVCESLIDACSPRINKESISDCNAHQTVQKLNTELPVDDKNESSTQSKKDHEFLIPQKVEKRVSSKISRGKREEMVTVATASKNAANFDSSMSSFPKDSTELFSFKNNYLDKKDSDPLQKLSEEDELDYEASPGDDDSDVISLMADPQMLSGIGVSEWVPNSEDVVVRTAYAPMDSPSSTRSFGSDDCCSDDDIGTENEERPNSGNLLEQQDPCENINPQSPILGIPVESYAVENAAASDSACVTTSLSIPTETCLAEEPQLNVENNEVISDMEISEHSEAQKSPVLSRIVHCESSAVVSSSVPQDNLCQTGNKSCDETSSDIKSNQKSAALDQTQLNLVDDSVSSPSGTSGTAAVPGACDEHVQVSSSNIQSKDLQIDAFPCRNVDLSTAENSSDSQKVTEGESNHKNNVSPSKVTLLALPELKAGLLETDLVKKRDNAVEESNSSVSLLKKSKIVLKSNDRNQEETSTIRKCVQKSDDSSLAQLTPPTVPDKVLTRSYPENSDKDIIRRPLANRKDVCRPSIVSSDANKRRYSPETQNAQWRLPHDNYSAHSYRNNYNYTSDDFRKKSSHNLSGNVPWSENPEPKLPLLPLPNCAPSVPVQPFSKERLLPLRSGALRKGHTPPVPNALFESRDSNKFVTSVDKQDNVSHLETQYMEGYSYKPGFGNSLNDSRNLGVSPVPPSAVGGMGVVNSFSLNLKTQNPIPEPPSMSFQNLNDESYQYRNTFYDQIPGRSRVGSSHHNQIPSSGPFGYSMEHTVGSTSTQYYVAPNLSQQSYPSNSSNSTTPMPSGPLFYESPPPTQLGQRDIDMRNMSVGSMNGTEQYLNEYCSTFLEKGNSTNCVNCQLQHQFPNFMFPVPWDCEVLKTVIETAFEKYNFWMDRCLLEFIDHFGKYSYEPGLKLIAERLWQRHLRPMGLKHSINEMKVCSTYWVKLVHALRNCGNSPNDSVNMLLVHIIPKDYQKHMAEVLDHILECLYPDFIENSSNTWTMVSCLAEIASYEMPVKILKAVLDSCVEDNNQYIGREVSKHLIQKQYRFLRYDKEAEILHQIHRLTELMRNSRGSKELSYRLEENFPKKLDGCCTKVQLASKSAPGLRDVRPSDTRPSNIQRRNIENSQTTISSTTSDMRQVARRPFPGPMDSRQSGIRASNIQMRNIGNSKTNVSNTTSNMRRVAGGSMPGLTDVRQSENRTYNIQKRSIENCETVTSNTRDMRVVKRSATGLMDTRQSENRTSDIQKKNVENLETNISNTREMNQVAMRSVPRLRDTRESENSAYNIQKRNSGNSQSSISSTTSDIMQVPTKMNISQSENNTFNIQNRNIGNIKTNIQDTTRNVPSMKDCERADRAEGSAPSQSAGGIPGEKVVQASTKNNDDSHCSFKIVVSGNTRTVNKTIKDHTSPLKSSIGFDKEDNRQKFSDSSTAIQGKSGKAKGENKSQLCPTRSKLMDRNIDSLIQTSKFGAAASQIKNWAPERIQGGSKYVAEAFFNQGGARNIAQDFSTLINAAGTSECSKAMSVIAHHLVRKFADSKRWKEAHEIFQCVERALDPFLGKIDGTSKASQVLLYIRTSLHASNAAKAVELILDNRLALQPQEWNLEYISPNVAERDNVCYEVFDACKARENLVKKAEVLFREMMIAKDSYTGFDEKAFLDKILRSLTRLEKFYDAVILYMDCKNEYNLVPKEDTIRMVMLNAKNLNEEQKRIVNPHLGLNLLDSEPYNQAFPPKIEECQLPVVDSDDFPKWLLQADPSIEASGERIIYALQHFNSGFNFAFERAGIDSPYIELDQSQLEACVQWRRGTQFEVPPATACCEDKMPTGNMQRSFQNNTPTGNMQRSFQNNMSAGSTQRSFQRNMTSGNMQHSFQNVPMGNTQEMSYASGPSAVQGTFQNNSRYQRYPPVRPPFSPAASARHPGPSAAFAPPPPYQHHSVPSLMESPVGVQPPWQNSSENFSRGPRGRGRGSGFRMQSAPRYGTPSNSSNDPAFRGGSGHRNPW